MQGSRCYSFAREQMFVCCVPIAMMAGCSNFLSTEIA